jgi:hypothetical protein
MGSFEIWSFVRASGLSMVGSFDAPFHEGSRESYRPRLKKLEQREGRQVVVKGSPAIPPERSLPQS